MATFKDKTGKEWTIELDAPLVRRIRTRLGIALTDLNVDPFKRLDIDPILMVDVLYLLCEKQAKALEMSEDTFGEQIGSELDEPRAALEDAIINFSPSSQRSVVTSLIEENKRNREQAMTVALTQLKASREDLVKAQTNQAKRQMKKLLDDMESPAGEVESSSTSSTDSTPKQPATNSPE